MLQGSTSNNTFTETPRYEKIRNARVQIDMEMFKKNPPAGITCKPQVDDVYDHLVARMKGPEGSPYERGTFELDIKIPEKYPMEPPIVKFKTPIYHPNIDKDGRICMDMLKTNVDEWLSTITLDMLLISIQSLLSNPNPDDPLVQEIAHEYKFDHNSFVANARKNTELNAMK